VVEISAAPVVRGAGGVVVVVTDVTQRDRVELADAEFVENAAHQLRNPIAAIASSIAALDAGARDDPFERDRFLGHVARESERMGRTVDALLTLADLQRGAGAPAVELIPLRPLIDDVVAATGFAEGVEPSIACGDEVAVVSHRELFAQALSNVLANAAEHTSSGHVRIRAGLEGATVVLDVTDSGAGIADEARPRVFDRFYRASSNGRRGSGLGLSIAFAAAVASGATLGLLDQREGEGATFRFTIPGARLL
jgi:signal transduction histidine kinase